MTTLGGVRRRRPGNRARIDAIKEEMDREVAQYRLRELREDAGYIQTSLAAAIGVGQNRVSQMEHGVWARAASIPSAGTSKPPAASLRSR